MAKEIAEEYASSLADLTVNSKPLINMLTILAEENVDHAGTIVETVEKHLEKVNPDVKLPVLYLVDSIIKNVGGAYIQKFSQSIVNMFTRTFRQVDEKIRSQMFKLRETWHDVFPATKMYQLDVKVNLVDPAWPIQAQPHQSNIHVNPNFLKKPATQSATVIPEEDEKMRSILAKKEQELLMLQKRKVEMELEQVRRQLELEKVAKKVSPKPIIPPVATPVAMVNPVPPLPQGTGVPEVASVSVKQRLGPPVSKASSGRIAPVSAALIAARRDPRLARHVPANVPPPTRPALLAPASAPAPAPQAPIAPNVFDIKPLERVTKRKNVITIDVRPDARRRDPRRDRRRDEPRPADDKPKRDDRLPTAYVDKIADARKISKLPPIPKLNRDPPDAANSKRRREVRERRRRPDRPDLAKDESSGSSPEKKLRGRRKLKEPLVEEPKPDEQVPFKELKNYHKERYMRRNREKSESPDRPPSPASAPEPNVPEAILENKDVDLRVLPTVDPKAAVVAQKRPSTETLEGKSKKNKVDKFDILFGNEDVDLRQLPQVDEVAPPPPSLTDSPKQKSPKTDKEPESKPMSEDEEPRSPPKSPKKDWNEVKEKSEKDKKTPSKLDLVRAKLAEATKGKDRLGRPLLFNKSPSIEKERERRRTISFEDTDMRNENGDEFDAEDNKKTISIIMSQAKEQFNDGQLDKTQYNALMYQVFQLNEKLKLKEAKQRESLEVSKLKLKEAKLKNKETLEASKKKLKAHIDGENKVASPKSSPNNFGDIDERIVPSAFMDTPPDSQGYSQDSDMRTQTEHNLRPMPGPPTMPGMGMFMNGPSARSFGDFTERPIWRGNQPRLEEFGPRRFRGPVPPFFRGKTRLPRPPFERMPLPQLPTPKMGICQGACPLQPYERSESPPPLGAPGFFVPPTDCSIIEYIDQDPVKTIQIDGVPREIRFYGDTAVIMLDWDDPREIKFLPGCRRVTFDNKDSVVLSFNEGYKQVDIEDQVFDIKFGAPTRELYINGRWHECFFGGNPLGVIIDGKPRLVHLEGPLPQVDIGKEKRMDLVAGKINLIVNATQMCPVYLDAKVQKFTVDNQVFTIRFVDALRTVLINEQPFKVEYGDLPKPIFIGTGKHFIRFSALPRNVKAGFVQIANMEGTGIPTVPNLPVKVAEGPQSPSKTELMEVDEPVTRPMKTPSPDANNENQGLDMLASVMPTTMEFASGSDYSVAEPLFPKTDKIPGLETPVAEKPAINLPGLGNINVTDLFAKLVATGIVPQTPKVNSEEKVEEKKSPKEDSTKVHRVDVLRPQTLRGKQPGIVTKLYGGMQCSGCGSRFPPEQTVRYSQHLDWHFRQNRRERDSARRAHSRHWHYDLSDWLQYEEIDEMDEREKNWFETTNAEEGEAPLSPAVETPSVAAGAPAECACALCGDKFDQFYNEDKEEWHLRNSVRHDDLNYHPMCFKDYKASKEKEEEEEKKNLELVSVESDSVAKGEPIEIKDVDDTLDVQSDCGSVVEVLEDDEKADEPLEIYDAEIEEEGEEDDVIYAAEPVEQVDVQDDADTDDETCGLRAERDKKATLDYANIKIKQEPVDPDDEPIITTEEEAMKLTPEPINTVLSSIDGNSQFESAAPAASLAGIRINISKAPIPCIISGPTTIPTIGSTRSSMLEDISTETDEEPLPPGEEIELQYTLKPALEGVRLSRTPPEKKGIEESGLCSIM